MNINFPTKIENVIKQMVAKKKWNNDFSSYYNMIVLSIATLKFILDNKTDDNIVCLYDNKKKKVIQEIDIDGGF